MNYDKNHRIMTDSALLLLDYIGLFYEVNTSWPLLFERPSRNGCIKMFI